MIEDLIEKLKPQLVKAPFIRDWSEEQLAARHHRFQLFRLRNERLASGLLPGRKPFRVAATACWDFPIYSQTFVYQELNELIQRGFDLRFLYSALGSRDHLPGQFSSLWGAKRKLVFHPSLFKRDYAHYQERVPERIEALVEQLCRVSGMTEAAVRGHYHFDQAFSFTRMVEAYRPDYLHSYFFYEGTLFMLFASYLLGIPRGVSCYADHLLNDYVMKAVPLHLEQCSVVVATSHRIKRELMGMVPHVDPEKIIVKPNAINAARFPAIRRDDPKHGEPYRLVCVNRIEPKKGTIYLVEAMRVLLDRQMNVELHVLGGVDESEKSKRYAETVAAKIKELSLERFVHLEGRQSEGEIRRCLESSQVFVAPFIETEYGDKDGIPTALLEAMATGIPVVATDAGSISEVIRDNSDGVMVPQRDAAALADAIQELLLNPQRRHSLGQQAAVTVRERFDVSQCEGLFHDRIRSVVKQHKTGDLYGTRDAGRGSVL